MPKIPIVVKKDENGKLQNYSLCRSSNRKTFENECINIYGPPTIPNLEDTTEPLEATGNSLDIYSNNQTKT